MTKWGQRIPNNWRHAREPYSSIHEEKRFFFLQKVNGKAWPEAQQSRGFLFHVQFLSSLYFAKPVRIRFVKFEKFTTLNLPRLYSKLNK